MAPVAPGAFDIEENGLALRPGLLKALFVPLKPLDFSQLLSNYSVAENDIRVPLTVVLTNPQQSKVRTEIIV